MTDEKPAETVEEKVEEIAETKQKVDEVETEENMTEKIAKMKADNDAMEIEQIRAEKLRTMSGRGIKEPEKNAKQEADEEAKRILSPFM